MKRGSLLLMLALFAPSAFGAVTDGTARDSVRILALGDSYTIGEGIDREAAWPLQLAERLRNAGINVDQPEILAATGWTSSDLEQALWASSFHAPYDLVTVMIGVNDQFKGGDLLYYQTRLERITKMAISLAGNNPSNVVVLSIPDYSVTPLGRQIGAREVHEEIDEFNEAAEAVADRTGVKFVDITDISRKPLRNVSLIADDGIHVSDRIHREWADQLYDLVSDSLGK